MISYIWHQNKCVFGQIDKWDHVKLKNFCASKDTINRGKRVPMEWEKYLCWASASGGLRDTISVPTYWPQVDTCYLSQCGVHRRKALVHVKVIGHSEGEKSSWGRDQPYLTDAPVSWVECHSLFVELLRWQDSMQFKCLQYNLQIIYPTRS